MIDHFTADIATAQDYYPFGMLMPGRTYTASTASNYRYGYNGKENDNEVKGVGDQIDYGQRYYDPRAGRFLSVDPITRNYPELTPYQYASNRPVDGVDVDGLEFGKMFMLPPTAWLPISTSWTADALAESRYNREHGIPDPGYGKHLQDRMRNVGIGAFVLAALIYTRGAVAENIWQIYPALIYNPVVQTEIISTVAALAGYQGPDIPSPGQVVNSTITRSWEDVAITTTNQGATFVGRQVLRTATLTIEGGSSFTNEGERRVVQRLLSEGNAVTLKAEVTSMINGIKSGKNADIYVNAIKTEIKTISAVADLSKAIKDRLSQASSQSKNVILDFVDQEGATLDEVKRGVYRYFGQSKGNMKEVRVIGKDFDEVIKNNKSKEN